LYTVVVWMEIAAIECLIAGTTLCECRLQQWCLPNKGPVPRSSASQSLCGLSRAVWAAVSGIGESTGSGSGSGMFYIRVQLSAPSEGRKLRGKQVIEIMCHFVEMALGQKAGYFLQQVVPPAARRAESVGGTFTVYGMEVTQRGMPIVAFVHTGESAAISPFCMLLALAGSSGPVMVAYAPLTGRHHTGGPPCLKTFR
jgi:hypothetical protein